LNWVQSFSIFSFLDSNPAFFQNASKWCIVAAGSVEHSTTIPPFKPTIDQLYKNNADWLFGHFCYDWKEELHHLPSKHPDYIGFTDAFLFVPELVIELTKNELQIHHFANHNPKHIYESIMSQMVCSVNSKPSVILKPKITKNEFIQTLQKIKAHIQRGDCYEINICQEWFAQNANIDPIQLYAKLKKVSPAPFAGLYRNNKSYAICASPERFVQKKGGVLYSQPIKGTNKRLVNEIENKQQQLLLQQNNKERSENIIVVDLVRNDLSRICEAGSVKVEELLGIYTFPQVNHLISTIKGNIQNDISFSDIMEALFPMGSMTGAPKKKVMQLIEKHEHSRRGLYAGTIGYITPNKNIDFNVMIRSFFYNADTKYLSYQVGSGITQQSDPEEEYQECLLKAEGLQKTLNHLFSS